MPSQTFTSSGSWAAPSNLVPGSVQVYATGEGGNSGSSTSAGHSGGGGGGGAFGGEPTLGGVTPGVTTLTITIGTGGTGTNTTVTGGSVTVQGNAGSSGAGAANGTGGAAGANTIAFKGGDGGTGISVASRGGGGGGGSAGSTGAGGNGAAGGSAGNAAGGTAGTGAAGPPSLAGAAGAQGGSPTQAGNNGIAPGSGAGGPGDSTTHVAATGAAGQVIIIWAVFTAVPAGTGSGTGTVAAAKKASGSFKGTVSGAGHNTNSPVVNQWAGTFAQPAVFGTTPPALQSLVLALTPATSAGPGSGTPTAGNWLICIAGWNQSGLPAATAGDADDIHSFWRPGNVTTSQWAVSTQAGATRCSVWYTPNLARVPGDVYVAPNGAVAGMACTVIEVAGLGPWDAVTGVYTNYAAAATALNLTLGAPSAASFVIAAVCGDSSAASQAFAPGGWTTLATVTASNGADHTCDAVLTSAYLSPNSGSLSVNATAGSPADLSGVILSVQVNAASPIPGGANPAWAGRMILEAAFGAGMETPDDQMTWTTLSDSAWTSTVQGYKRFWGWQDSSGVPYALGQLQSGTGSVQLDNADGLVSPSNSSSPFFPDLQPGTPVRLRMALGTLTDGTVVNRWYTWRRDALAWPERRNKALRGYVPLTLTDVWSVVSGSGPTPYRGEVEQDAPYAWWPMDDQPGAGGVQPAFLLNAAAGNSNVLTITASPGGVTAGDQYSTSGTDITSTSSSTQGPPGLAVAAAAQQQGWMYGDPQSSPQTSATGNPVTANPGSAAWQQTGALGTGGAHGWFLTCNDVNFPALSGGVTIEGWFNCGFFGSPNGAYINPTTYDFTSQPYSVITLATLSTNSAPVAELQLDLSGHLNLITFNGTTPTSHAVYTSSDLRCSGWVSVTAELTPTTWACYVNAGLTATASGTVSAMTSAWTWLTLNGDYGNTSGGSTPANIQHGGNVAYSHWEVYPSLLPAWRVLAHYCAAATGFGLLPAPQQVALSTVASLATGPSFVPDGSEFQGTYGGTGGVLASTYSFSAVTAAQAGSYTSGPSARAAIAGIGTNIGGNYIGSAVWVSWSSLCPQTLVYTSASAGAETNAATCCGSGDSFTSGFGGSASGHGVCQTASGTGASPPAAPSSLGDTVAQRVERVLGYGGVTRPNRAIDSTASLLVQAALDVGGQQTGANIQNLVDSDNGLLYVDNNGTLCYRSRAHLAADTPVWQIGMNVIAGMSPFDDSIEWSSDPQRIWDAITITPYSPDGASLASLTPSNATAANAAQDQFGARPKQVTSYLQDQTKMQAQADWYLANFAALQRRASVVAIDAASHPAAWLMVAGMNPGDIAQIYDAPIGQPATTGNYRVSQISRSVSYGANGSKIEARMVLVLDPLPASYWS